MELDGRAAKLKRGAQLRAREHDEELINEELEGVGNRALPFVVGDGAAGPLGELPSDFSLRVAHEEAARAMLIEYHTTCCKGAPKTQAGRDHALLRGWAAPQQAYALCGRNNPGGPLCNLAVMAVDERGPVGLMAAAYHGSGCVVQAVHVALRVRGPARLPEHLWARTKQALRDMPAPGMPGVGAAGGRAVRAAKRAAIPESKAKMIPQ